VPAAKEDLALYERVREQYQLYWTETGRAKLDRGGLERATQSAADEIRKIEEELRALERDVERAATLDSELLSFGPRCVDQEKRVAGYAEAAARLDRLMLQAQTTKATADTAAAKSDKAARAVSDRAEMIAKLEGQTVERQRIAAAVDESAPDVGACRDQNDADSKAVAQARTDRETCDVLARLLRADVSFLRKLREMVDLGRRSEAVRGAHEVLASIQVELDKIRIDARTLAELRSADVRLKTARASLGSAMPSFRLEAFAATVVDIDGETTTVKPGAVVEKTVPAASCITVPGVISLTVMPGVTDAGLVAEAHAAERAFSDLCATTGVADVAQGEVAVSARRRLESDRVELEVRRAGLGGDRRPAGAADTPSHGC
jgi:hypothetical protein